MLGLESLSNHDLYRKTVTGGFEDMHIIVDFTGNFTSCPSLP